MDTGVARQVILVAAREFPKGSMSMRTRNSVIQYLRAGKMGEGGGEGSGQVTRPAFVSQFGHSLEWER